MKKIIALLLVATNSINCSDRQPLVTISKIDTTYHHTIRETPDAISYRDVRILSNYDLSKERATLNAMIDSQNSVIDLRPIEKCIIKKYNQSLPLHMKHCGKLGFISGIGIISIPLLYMTMWLPRFNK